MPLPQSLIRFKPPESLHVRVGDKLGKHGAPRALDHFVGKVMDSGQELGDHPFFAGKPREIPMRLLFDDPAMNWRAGIAWWDGHFPACHNDLGGFIAMRRSPDNAYKEVSCDLTRCPLWLNARGDSERVKQALVHPTKGWAISYPHLKITRESVCKPQFYLLFAIPGVTSPGEVARFYTQSLTTINQIMSSITILASETGGILAGVPLKLKVYMIPNRFGSGHVPTVSIMAAENDYEKWQQMVLETRNSRKLSGMNWQAHKELVAEQTLSEMTGVDREFIRTHFVRDQDEVLVLPSGGSPEFAAPESLDDSVLEDDTVQRMIETLGLPVPDRTKLKMRFGTNVQDCIDYLAKIFDERGLLLDEDDEAIRNAIEQANDADSAESANRGGPVVIEDDNEDEDEDEDEFLGDAPRDENGKLLDHGYDASEDADDLHPPLPVDPEPADDADDDELFGKI